MRSLRAGRAAAVLRPVVVSVPEMSDSDEPICGACGQEVTLALYKCSLPCCNSVLHNPEECSDVWQPTRFLTFCGKLCAVRYYHERGDQSSPPRRPPQQRDEQTQGLPKGSTDPGAATEAPVPQIMTALRLLGLLARGLLARGLLALGLLARGLLARRSPAELPPSKPPPSCRPSRQHRRRRPSCRRDAAQGPCRLPVSCPYRARCMYTAV